MDLDEIAEWRRQRMEALAKVRGGNAALGRELGYQDGAFVGQMIKGTKPITEKTIAKAHALKGCSGWFTPPEAPNVAPVEARRRVPLVSWVIAGQWADVQDNFHPGEADEWTAPSHSSPGRHAFSLRVVGDSMTNPVPGGRSFPHGTILIVDPERAADAGDYVIAKDVQTQKATFKQLTTDGGRWFLKPLNPTYPTMEIDDPAMRVIGRVVEFQLGEKL